MMGMLRELMYLLLAPAVRTAASSVSTGAHERALLDEDGEERSRRTLEEERRLLEDLLARRVGEVADLVDGVTEEVEGEPELVRRGGAGAVHVREEELAHAEVLRASAASARSIRPKRRC